MCRQELAISVVPAQGAVQTLDRSREIPVLCMVVYGVLVVGYVLPFMPVTFIVNVDRNRYFDAIVVGNEVTAVLAAIRDDRETV